MKKLLVILVLAFVASAQAQVIVTNLSALGNVPMLIVTGNDISNIVAGIDESTNLFTPKEIEVRIGGVYSQKTGDAGVLIAAEKWDLFTPNLGVGIESVQSGQDQAAEFAYVSYRKLLGNTSGALFLGGGYDELNKKMMGVVGLRLEHRFSKHVGAWTSIGYGLEAHSTNGRGMLTGAGVSYAF